MKVITEKDLKKTFGDELLEVVVDVVVELEECVGLVTGLESVVCWLESDVCWLESDVCWLESDVCWLESVVC